jgi:hypothetical protein
MSRDRGHRSSTGEWIRKVTMPTQGSTIFESVSTVLPQVSKNDPEHLVLVVRLHPLLHHAGPERHDRHLLRLFRYQTELSKRVPDGQQENESVPDLGVAGRQVSTTSACPPGFTRRSSHISGLTPSGSTGGCVQVRCRLLALRPGGGPGCLVHHLHLPPGFLQAAGHEYLRVPGAAVRQNQQALRVVFVHVGPLLVLADRDLHPGFGAVRRHRDQHPLHHSGGVRRLHLLHHSGGIESCGLDRYSAIYRHHRRRDHCYCDRDQVWWRSW